MDNLVSTCYVITSLDYGTEPVIYLRLPEADPAFETVMRCSNPWEAKTLITRHCRINYKKIWITTATYSIVSQLIRENQRLQG